MFGSSLKNLVLVFAYGLIFEVIFGFISPHIVKKDKNTIEIRYIFGSTFYLSTSAIISTLSIIIFYISFSGFFAEKFSAATILVYLLLFFGTIFVIGLEEAILYFSAVAVDCLRSSKMERNYRSKSFRVIDERYERQNKSN